MDIIAVSIPKMVQPSAINKCFLLFIVSGFKMSSHHL